MQIYPPASAMKSTQTSDNNLYVKMKCSHSDITPPFSDEVHTDMRYQFIFCNCHHFATDCLHDYIQFTIYCLEVNFQCCDAQEISAISPKTCTLKLQLLHNTKRPTKWSGHVKMIDPPKRTSTYERPFTQEGNYLVSSVKALWCSLDHI